MSIFAKAIYELMWHRSISRKEYLVLFLNGSSMEVMVASNSGGCTGDPEEVFGSGHLCDLTRIGTSHHFTYLSEEQMDRALDQIGKMMLKASGFKIKNNMT